MMYRQVTGFCVCYGLLIGSFSFSIPASGQTNPIEQKKSAVADQLLVQFKPGNFYEVPGTVAVPLVIGKELQALSSSQRSFLSSIYRVIVLDQSASNKIEEVRKSYAARSEVQRAELDAFSIVLPTIQSSTAVATAAATANPTPPTPNDPYFGSQWGLQKIQTPLAWAGGFTSAENAVIASIDSGADFIHEDLQTGLIRDPLIHSLGYHCEVPGNDAIDDIGFGTYLAGIMGADTGNGIGIAGINWKAKILSMKAIDAYGSLHVSTVVKCLVHLQVLANSGLPDSYARVLNIPWYSMGRSLILEDAFHSLLPSQTLVVSGGALVAANHDIEPIYPAAFQLRNSIAVLPTDAGDQILSTAGYGTSTIDLGAPGSGILSTVPKSNCPLCDPSGYLSLTGSAPAVAMTSAVAAQLISTFPALSLDHVRDLLLRHTTVDVVPSLYRMNTSSGRINHAKICDRATQELGARYTPNLPPKAEARSSLTSPAAAGDSIRLTGTIVDPDAGAGLSTVGGSWGSKIVINDFSLLDYMVARIFDFGSVYRHYFVGAEAFQFTAPSLARDVSLAYQFSANDGNGGAAAPASVQVGIQKSPQPGQPPEGRVYMYAGSQVAPNDSSGSNEVSLPYQWNWVTIRLKNARDPDHLSDPLIRYTYRFDGKTYCCWQPYDQGDPYNPFGNVVAGPFIEAGKVYRVRFQMIDGDLDLTDSSPVFHPVDTSKPVDIIVRKQTTDGLVPQGMPPMAKFSLNPSTISAGSSVLIDTVPAYDQDGTIVHTQVSCGNGMNALFLSGDSVSGVGKYSCSYPVPGNYAVELVVEDDSGYRDSAISYLAVQ